MERKEAHQNPIVRAILFFLALNIIFLSLAQTAGAAPKNFFYRRYIYYWTFFGASYEPARMINVMKRAAGEGYNGMVTGDYEAYNYQSMGKAYNDSLAKVRESAKALGITLIPYLADVQFCAPQLLEGLPVRNTKFIANAGSAQVMPNPAATLKNPGFESFKGDTALDWGVRYIGIKSFIDRNIRHGGIASLRIQDPQGEMKIFQGASLDSFKAYELSVWIKTENYAPAEKEEMSFLINGSGRTLYLRRDTPMGGSVANTQDWKKYAIDFNTLECASVNIFLFVSHLGGTGKVWFDDFQLREVGLYETVQRASLPVSVTSLDHTKTYQEGPDYVVETERLTIPSGSGIKSGDIVLVSWFQRGDMESSWTTPSSFCHEEFYQAIKNKFIRMSEALGSNKSCFLNYDEWRLGFWDPECIAKYANAGEYWADAMRNTERVLKEVNPDVEIYVWSDMFDPYHNGNLINDMMINGSVAGSWNGVSQSTIIANWNGGNPYSYKFFAGIDSKYPLAHHAQMIGGYYDNLNRTESECQLALKAESLGVTGIVGYMHTTWQDNYDEIEAVAQIGKKYGLWGTNADPFVPLEHQGIQTSPGESRLDFWMIPKVDLYKQLAAIQYEVPCDCRVSIRLVNSLGQVVRQIVHADQKAGIYKVQARVSQLPAGIYFLTLNIKDSNQTAEKRLTQKIAVF